MFKGKTISPFNLAVTAVFTALVCVVTIIFSIYVPATEGFFNIGESMVFLSALLFGPFVGAFAGGVGSMLADLLLGYPHYAPATLIIKACEGAVVGTLKKRKPKLLKLNYIGIVGGILAFVSLALPWWTSSTILGNIDLYLFQITTPSGVPFTLLAKELLYCWAALALGVLGGLLGIVGSVTAYGKKLLVGGGALVLLSIIIFAAGLQMHLSSLGAPFGLFSSGLGYSTYLSFGFWLALVAAIIVFAASRKTPVITSRLQWKFFTMVLGVVAGFLLGWVGTAYYSGELELTLGSGLFVLYVPAEFWIFLSVITALSIAALGFLADPEFGWTVFSVIAGGFVMVLGYFLYQWFVIYPLFKIEVVAIAEIPVNIGQMVIGATVALPIAKIVWRVLPYLKEK